MYENQKEMLDNKKHSVKDRIVNLSEPYVRPIVSNKQVPKQNLVQKLK